MTGRVRQQHQSNGNGRGNVPCSSEQSAPILVVFFINVSESRQELF